MNNSVGYIRQWNPMFQTGVLFGCGGVADGKNVAFHLISVNDHALQQALIASPGFQLPADCTMNNVRRVSFFDDNSGFAQNILSV